MPDIDLLHLTTKTEHGSEKFPNSGVFSLDPNIDLSGVRGLYLHVPFCFHKCHYCDFYSFVDQRGQQDAFVDRLVAEVRRTGELLDHAITTIFVGGGTPTLLRVDLWARLAGAIRDSFELTPDYEWTVEANPETVTDALAETLVRGGVNRISIGAQSFDRRHLHTLERHHDPDRVLEAIAVMHRAGIENINLDLICAIPGQTCEAWEKDLRLAAGLDVTHLSCYTLMYEPNTPLTTRLERGEVARVDEDAEAEMYRFACSYLPTIGFEHYEISNWARPGARCAHNVLYWENQDWWPLGPSASGHVDGRRWKIVPRLGDYLASSGWPPVVDFEHREASDRVGEAFILRLRMLEGIGRTALDELLDQDRDGRREVLDSFVASGLLRWTDDRLHLTSQGLLLADGVFSALI